MSLCILMTCSLQDVAMRFGAGLGTPSGIWPTFEEGEMFVCEAFNGIPWVHCR